MNIPENVLSIINKIEENNFEAYLVGGCVRDHIIGRIPQDYDIASNAMPEDIVNIFNGYEIKETGIKHGTVMVISDKMPFEITTYRTDGIYTDSRHPDSVHFVSDIKEDLARRDFTVNAAAYSPERGFADPFGAGEDIRNKIIRCVGNPKKRFGEDALRILRAVRFSSQLGFKTDDETKSAVMNMYTLLSNVSEERKTSEILKTFAGVSASDVIKEYAEVFMYLIPAFKKNEEIFLKNIERLRSISLFNPDDITIMAAVFCGMPDAERTMENMRIPKRKKYAVCQLISCCEEPPCPDKRSIRKALVNIGKEQLERLLVIMFEYDEYKKRYDILMNIIQENKCLSIRDMAVSGNDIMSIFGYGGAYVGVILKRLFDVMTENDIENDRTVLLKTAENIIQKGDFNGN